MSTIRLATAANVRAFQTLSHGLNTTTNKWADSIDHEALDDEIGRFRVWSGNLGALQKGHSSLDYRLRDSPLLSSNALKFLKELEDNLNEAYAVVSEARLPYEQQATTERQVEDEDEHDNFFDEDEDEDDDDDSGGSRTELSMRFAEVVDIIDNLYKLSVRIRTPTIRSRSLKAATFNPKDPETGIDLLSMYAGYDVQHIKELLEHLRRPHEDKSQEGVNASADGDGEADYLIMRLSAAITSRRRQFKYWKRHRDKLGMSTIIEDKPPTLQPSGHRPEPQRHDTLEVIPDMPVVVPPRETPSQKTGRTMLSGTEATQHHQSLDEIVDNKSVTSYAVTVKDIQGKGVNLPPPPKAADGERDFECPYCYIICPARYGRGRAWRTHLLQDLQPYVCTYPGCESAEQLFRSRREWAAHESTHRKLWRCPEHPNAVYKTQGGLEHHLRQAHQDSFPESQLPAIVKVGETAAVDLRASCPICHAPSDLEGLGDFHNHIANHLERIATFALPNGLEDDADGASSVASRGRSDSSNSRDMKGLSLPSDTDGSTDGGDDDIERNQSGTSAASPLHNAPIADVAVSNTEGRPMLSVENLDQMPDGTHNRINTLMIKTDDPENFVQAEREEGGDQNAPLEHSEDAKEQVEQEEGLRLYIGSFPGCQKVTLDPRYDFRRGQALFENETMAANALREFDNQQFPYVDIRESPKSLAILNITITTSRSNAETAVLNSVDIPTLRSMYRSRVLLQRDQSVVPNDSYNQVISFCYYDLTKLKVDAIVNSANRAMKSTSGDTLNNAIYRAAGPELAKETASYGKLGTDAVVTSGYNLPSSHIIHILRPGYHNQTNSGHLKQLRDCYHNALSTARVSGIKTIAFPCVGTGGVGFPSKVAARIALQEVRDYLDGLSDYKFERIIFCVNTAADEQAYMDFLPAYFPPTFDDADIARQSLWIEDRGALALKVLDTRSQVQKVFAELNGGLSITVPDFPQSILKELDAIDTNLASIRNFMLWSKDIRDSLTDLKLACSIMQAVCGNLTEAVELAKDVGNTPSRSDQSVWDDFNADMRIRHGSDIEAFLRTCRDFIGCLDDIITRNGKELEEMATMRQTLEEYKATRNVGGVESSQSRLSAFDEVLYLREYQRQAVESPSIGTVVNLSQVPSVAQLYKLGELDEKTTMAHPSAMFNNTVCLIRNSITKLQVDVLVNSTDRHFASMGTLDRSVFAKGGPEMREAVTAFAGKCEVGDVKTTPGYLLPAKHVLHVIPPNQYGHDTKRILRDIYRQVLHTAINLHATSIALPCIGTGMLNYPRKDSASLAMEEVKRFLETADQKSVIEKIIFVVYSSNDEYVYKSILPVYFPPVDLNVNRALPASQPVPVEESGTNKKPRRRLFGSIRDAIRSVTAGSSSRSVSFGQRAAPWRRPDTDEQRALISFESHADGCETCNNPKRLYLEDKKLCERGYHLAQSILRYMQMREDQKVYSNPNAQGHVHELEVSGEMFPLSRTLLEVVERSFHDRNRPFVSPNRPHEDTDNEDSLTSRYASDSFAAVDTPPTKGEQRQMARAHVSVGKADGGMMALMNGYGYLRIHANHVEVHEFDVQDEHRKPLLQFTLGPSTRFKRYKTTPEISVYDPQTLQGTIKLDNFEILLRCPGDPECNRLLRLLQQTTQQLVSIDESRVPGSLKTSSAESQTSGDTVPISKGDQNTADDYREWNKRLKDIRNQLSSDKKPSGGLSDLRFKIDRLNKATSNFQSTDRGSNDEVPDSEVQNSQRTALAALLLDYLTQDLKTRHGSYIGMKFDDIVSGLRMTPAELEVALSDLASKNLVHNTIDDETWVVSDPPEGLSVVPKDVVQHKDRRVSSATSNQSGSTRAPLSHLAEWIVSFIPYEVWSSSEAGVHRDISLKKQVSLDSVDRALWQLSQKTRWYNGRVSSMKLERGVVLAGGSTPAGHWTHIDKSIVDTRVLRSLGVEFEDLDDSIMLQRALEKGEFIDWTERSRNIMEGQDLEVVIASPEVEKTPTASSEQSLSTLASTIHGFLVLNHQQSYLVEDLATGFGFSQDAMTDAISELAARNMVHDAGEHKWAVTLPGDDDPPEEVRTSEQQLSPVAAKVIEQIDRDPTKTYSSVFLSGALVTSLQGINLALIELSNLNLVRHIHGDTWTSTKNPDFGKKDLGDDDREETSTLTDAETKPHIRDPSTFTNTPPSPTLQPSFPTATDRQSMSELSSELDNITIDDFTSPFGTRWTRLEKRLIDPTILTDADEEFDDTGDALVVHRVLRRGEIQAWAEKTRALRDGRKERLGWRREGTDKNKGKGKGKGKGKEVDSERDAVQGRLDRVLAGDMKEGELRHFADDGEDERYI